MSEWVEQAVCRSVDPELWFPEGGMNNRWSPVFRICASCPVRRDCLKEALDLDIQFGIWGGVPSRVRERIRWRKKALQERERILDRLLERVDDRLDENDEQRKATRDRVNEAKVQYRKRQKAS